MSERPNTEIMILIDRSGSMFPIRSDVVGAINGYVEGQKDGPGKCRVTVAQFDGVHPFEIIRHRGTVDNWQPITDAEYQPRGSTPLLDAMGRAVHEVKTKANRQIVLVVMTDGQENTSTEYDRSTIKSLVEQKTTDEEWLFVYLGANVDAFDEAHQLGIRNAENYVADGQGIFAAAASVGNLTSSARMARSTGTSFDAGSAYDDLGVERLAEADHDKRA